MGRIHAILSDGTVVTDVEVWLLSQSSFPALEKPLRNRTSHLLWNTSAFEHSHESKFRNFYGIGRIQKLEHYY